MAQKKKNAGAQEDRLAQTQGDAFGDAVNYRTLSEAAGAEQRVGDYLIGCAAEEAAALYVYDGAHLRWEEPQFENAHIQIMVRSAADGRFLPGLVVTVSVYDEMGAEIGRHQHDFLWHPWLYHYGRNWMIPRDGLYTVGVHVQAPLHIARHGKEEGRRFMQDATAAFAGIRMPKGRKKA